MVEDFRLLFVGVACSGDDGEAVLFVMGDTVVFEGEDSVEL